MSCDHSYTSIFSGPGVHVGNFHCRAPKSGPSPEELTARDSIVFIRRGVYEKRHGSRSIAATSGHALLYREGEVYQTCHPAHGGDDCTVFEFDRAVVRDVERELTGRDSERAFGLMRDAFVTPAELHLRQWRLLKRLEGGLIDDLEAHEEILRLCAGAMRCALEHGSLPGSRRTATARAHRELAHDTALLLAGAPCRRWSLDQIASSLHSSTFHLSRVFQREMDVPIHRFLVRLRLREAVNRLASGANDLTVLALDLGFATRGHFSDAFRREFRVAPSAVRRELRAG